ncbi:MAG: HD domain-containing protein [Methanofastidiosum sp.]
MDRLETFKTELAYIKNPKIKEFTEKVLLEVPDYFFNIPASSTGKYHPAFSLGEGGLSRHVKAAIRIAVDMLSLEMFNKYSEDEKDIIISSLILHDCAKNGISGGRYSITEHPLIMADFIAGKEEYCSLLEKDVLDKILGCIRTHMGEFVKDYKTKKEVLPKPQSKLENIVHLADYLSSRKYFEGFDFDVVVPRDRVY